MQISQVPKLAWAALVVSVLGFVVSLSSSSTVTTNGVVTSCSTFDLAPLLAAGVSLVLAIAAYGERRRKHVDARLPMPWMHGITALVTALAVVHVLRALGVIGSAC